MPAVTLPCRRSHRGRAVAVTPFRPEGTVANCRLRVDCGHSLTHMSKRLLCAVLATTAAATVAAGLAAPATAALLFDGGDAKVHISVRTPWKSDRGDLTNGYASTAFALVVKNPSRTGRDIVASIPKITGTDGEKFRGAYAWVQCPFDPTNRPIDATCKVLQGSPDTRERSNNPIGIEIQGNRVMATGAWISPNAQGALWGVTSVLNIPYEAAGHWVTLAWTLQRLDQNLVPTGAYSSGVAAESVFAVAYTPVLVVKPAVTSAAVAGQPWTAVGAEWNSIPIGAISGTDDSTAWLCTKASAATDTSLLWDLNGGCTRASAAVPWASGGARMSGVLPADSVGKYLLINNNLVVPPAKRTAMIGDFSYAARSAAIQVTASATAAPGAAPSASAAPQAPAGSSGGTAPANAATTDAAALAAGAGVNLAQAPLVGADGRGTGASANLTIGLDASPSIVRGRYISMKSVIGPASSTGRVRIALVRTNANGAVVSSKALFAPVKRGVATKRWKIPRTYAPGTYTMVVTYLPSQKGAPGVTSTVPVTIQ